jgi:hypothetical protein
VSGRYLYSGSYDTRLFASRLFIKQTIMFLTLERNKNKRQRSVKVWDATTDTMLRPIDTLYHTGQFRRFFFFFFFFLICIVCLFVVIIVVLLLLLFILDVALLFRWKSRSIGRCRSKTLSLPVRCGDTHTHTHTIFIVCTHTEGYLCSAGTDSRIRVWGASKLPGQQFFCFCRSLFC